MKRFLCVLLLLAMMLSLCSCGDSTTRGHGTQTPSTSESQGSNSTPNVAAETAKWEITYQDSTIYRDAIGNVSCYAIVEVENTGTLDLYLDDATFDFEDQNGGLLATYSSMISADPDIIAPGEKGYFYCNMATLKGDIDETTEYVFNPTVKVKESKNDIVRYDISDVSISEGGYMGQVTIIGRVTNNTEDDNGLVWVSCILYRADGTPIGAYGTNVTDLAAGETASFDATSLYLSDLDFSIDDIAEYKVYACKTQYQF